MSEDHGYNERLFNSGIRKQVHLARFVWLRKMMSAYSINETPRVLELGCFDGRSIDWLPTEPSLYDGFDANWEGGLDIGRKHFAGRSNIHFHQCSSPDEMTMDAGGYDIGISLETMEHVPPEMVNRYLEKFAQNVKTAVFFSAPNEIGIPFAIKSITKKIIYRDSKDEVYSTSEFWNEVLGRTDLVHRNEHKGFDYRKFVSQMEKYFLIDRVEGIPNSWLPTGLTFTIGIVAKPNRN